MIGGHLLVRELLTTPLVHRVILVFVPGMSLPPACWGSGLAQSSPRSAELEISPILELIFLE